MKKTPISREIKKTFPADWPKWVLRSLTELDNTETVVTKSRHFKVLPGWVQSMLMEAILVMFPSVPRTNNKQTGIELLGRIIGHLDYLLESDEASEAQEIQIKKLNEANKKIDSICREKLSAEDYEKDLKAGNEIIGQHMPLFELLEEVLQSKVTVIQHCLKTAVMQTYEERQEFFKAYSTAQSMPLFNKQGHLEFARVRTKIYLVMIFYWPMIEKRDHIKTNTDLHRWLVKLLPSGRITRDSVRKICKEHGLKLSTVGRPRKIGKN